MAGLFNLFPDFAKNGPGIDKDAPPKTGLALFIDIYRREWWNIFKLNLLFLLFCIPVVTIVITLAPRAWRTTSATTLAPSTSGRPIVTVSPSETSSALYGSRSCRLLFRAARF